MLVAMKTVPKESWWREYFPQYYLAAQEYLLTEERTAGEVEVLRRLLSDRGVDLILDAGCADGRILIPLSKSGYRVIGLDLSADSLFSMLDRDPSARGVRGDWKRMPFADNTFGAVLSVFSSFGYTDSIEDNLAPLLEFGRVLEPGGLLVLDMPDGEFVRDYLHMQKNHEMKSGEYTIKTLHRLRGPFILSAQEVLREGRDPVRFEIVMQLFSAIEMAGHLRVAGFSIVGVLGDLSTKAPRVEGAPRMVFLAEKDYPKEEELPVE